MNWLNEFVKPGLKKLVGSANPDIKADAWLKDPITDEMVHRSDVEKNGGVFPSGHHMRISAHKRAKLIFDDGAYTVVEIASPTQDPLKFRDLKKYPDRLKENKAKANIGDALLVAHGKMDGLSVVSAIMDFNFMGGSMGMAVGEGLLSAARLSVLQGAPLIAFTSSGGARMQEGILSLMQLPRTTIAVQLVKEAGLPFIVVHCDPTTGGVSASFAMLGDIHLAEPQATIGFAGRRVIEQTVRETLPEGFQTAEYLMQHGMVDEVVSRDQLKSKLSRILKILMFKMPDDVAAFNKSDLDDSNVQANQNREKK